MPNKKGYITRRVALSREQIVSLLGANRGVRIAQTMTTGERQIMHTYVEISPGYWYHLAVNGNLVGPLSTDGNPSLTLDEALERLIDRGPS